MQQQHDSSPAQPTNKRVQQRKPMAYRKHLSIARDGTLRWRSRSQQLQQHNNKNCEEEYGASAKQD